MIDANQEHATMAITNDGNDTPTDLVVDETTGRLLVYIINETIVAEPRSYKSDANQEWPAIAYKDDDSDVAPLLVTDSGAILVDLSIEA
jgi:hypothetical protein